MNDLHLQTGSNPKPTPAVTSTLLHKDTNSPDMQPEFHYCSVIGKLNFLEKSMRLDISVSVHQCARLSESPKKSHAEAVKRIGRYLLATRDKGLIIHPNKAWHFDCWVDADFAGNWRQADAHMDPMTSKSRSGWIVWFAGAPITWASKMQTITAMSTSEAEYIALSTSIREVIGSSWRHGHMDCTLTTYCPRSIALLLKTIAGLWNWLDSLRFARGPSTSTKPTITSMIMWNEKIS